jgi:hypothetical protein
VIHNTYRVRSAELPFTVLVDAGSADEAILCGALFFLIHGLINNLAGSFTSEPWNACLEDGEYVPASFFAEIVPQLTTLVTAAGRSSGGYGLASIRGT